MEVIIKIEEGKVAVEVCGEETYIYQDVGDGILVEMILEMESFDADKKFVGQDGIASIVAEQVAALIRRV